MSERKTLTKMVLDQRPPKAGRKEVRDSESPIVFRITSSGARSFCVRTRITGQQTRVTFPKVPSIDNLPEARRWARETVDGAKRGDDPREVKAQSEAALQRTIERAEKLKFENVARDYLERRVRGEKKNRTADEIERMFEVYFLPKWKGVPINQISRADVVALMDDIFDREVEFEGKTYGGNVAADKALAQLRACFNWVASRDDKFTSPIAKGMARTKPSERARERVLSDEEIRVLWGAAAGQGVFGGIVMTLLLTAQRRDEVSAMAHSEIDANGVWTIPAERYKTKKPNIVPLSKAALAVIAEQDRINGSGLVFTTNGKTPFSGYSKAKAALDEAMEAALDHPLAPWRLHDLRRTARTLMAKADVRPDIAERVLGHTLKGVEGIYDRSDYVELKRAALERLAAAVERIINPPADNVVALRVAAE